MKSNWQNITVKATSSVKETLELIDREGLRMALVVSDDMSLLGAVTDGDIRRGFLRGENLESTIDKLMTKDPITADISSSRYERVQLMKLKGIFFVPILDSGKLVGIENLNLEYEKGSVDNPVFLMAGGFGSRLKPLTDNCPKPMLKVGDKPILETTLLHFINSGFKNFYISTHYLPEVIRDYFGNGEKWGVNINYVHEEIPLGTGGALGLLPYHEFNKPIIMMNGDVLTNIDLHDLLNFHNSHNAYATMSVREYEYQIPYGVIQGDGVEIKSMVEKPVQRHYVNTGIYVIEPGLVKQLEPNVRTDMPTLIERNLSGDKKVLMYSMRDYWLDIGQMDDFERAQKDIELLWK